MVNLDEHPLLIEPVVAWPRVAETECDYLVTVDLRGPLPEGSDPERVWPYPEEEFTFTVALDGSPYFVCAVLDEPSVVLHRFGGTYGPAHFKVSTGRATGHGALWLTVSNQWGVPVRKAELRSEVREREPGRAPAARLAEVMRQRASLVRPSERTGDSSWSQEPVAGMRVADIRSTATPGPDTPSSTAPHRRLRLGRQTITISFTPFDQDWADWISHRLEQRGHRVVPQRWDPPRDASLAESLRDLLLAPGPVLLLLSDQYLLSGTHNDAEWDSALREVLVPEAERVAVVSVAPSPPQAFALDAISLYDVSADEAERRLLGRLALPADPEPRSTTGAADEPPFPVHTLRVWGRIPERNERFTGRVALLNTAYERLQRENRVTLCGLSGVGKTQLAAEYAYRFAYGYHVVWWINAGSRAAFRQGLADLAPALGLRTGTGHGERYRAVREALRRGEPYGRWLLILDGADDPGEVRDLVPTGPGHVLITSCNQDWGDHNSALVQVPAYDRAESVDFIRRRAPRLTDDDARRLAEALADLPLVLDQTAGWLDESGMSVAEYLELLARDSATDDLVVSPDFPMTFRTAWAVLLERLRAGCPNSVLLLRLCTFFAPDAVPLRLLREIPADGLPPAVAQLLTDTGRWNEAVEQLRTYSVVRIEQPAQDPEGEVLSMHRLVHQTVRDDMSAEEKRELADVAWRALAAADPGNPDQAGTWSRYADFVPHLEYTDVLSSDAEAAQQLVFNCLRYLYVSGEYETGIRLAEQVMSVWQQLQDGNADLLWELGHHYANLLRVVGDYRNSEAVSRAAVEQFRSVGGVGDSRYLRAAGGLAADLRALGRFEEALDLSREVHEGYRERRGEQHEDTLAAENNMAMSLRLLGRYGEAADIDQRVFHARERVLGADHFWTLLSEVHWATDLRLMGRYEEAQRRQRANVGKYREALGDNHPYSFQALYNLAQCEYRAGDTESAGERFATVLARCERLLGKDDPLTLMFAVARCCYAREHGDVDHARRLSEAVVDRYERRLGSAHPYSAGARANHALILRTVGEHRQARALGERALADMTQAVGATHPWTLGCAVNVVAGSPDRAVVAELGRETVARAAERLGADHRLTRVARAALDEDNGRRIYWDFEPQTT